MGGRAKTAFLTKDGRWVLYWRRLGDPVVPDSSPDYTGELILALASLTEKQRFVIECRYGLRGDREMTVCEIATLMGVSHQAVVRLIQRALKGLYRGLQDSPIDANIPEIEGAPFGAP